MFSCFILIRLKQSACLICEAVVAYELTALSDNLQIADQLAKKIWTSTGLFWYKLDADEIQRLSSNNDR